MGKQKLIRVLCLSGLVALLFYVLHDVVGGLYYPGYNRMTQAVSDLTAVNAPSRVVAGGLSTAYGLFACLCCTLVSIIAYENRIGTPGFRLGVYLFSIMNWVSAVGYALFPLSAAGYAGTFQDFMHLYGITIPVVLLSILSLILLIIGGTRSGKATKGMPLWAGLALGCMVIGAIGTGAAPAAYFGVLERFSTYSAVLFTAVLGLYGYRFFYRGSSKATPEPASTKL